MPWDRDLNEKFKSISLLQSALERGAWREALPEELTALTLSHGTQNVYPLYYEPSFNTTRDR